MQFQIGLEPFIHCLFGDGIVKCNIFFPESGAIICADCTGNRDRNDHVDDRGNTNEFDNEHIAPPSAN